MYGTVARSPVETEYTPNTHSQFSPSSRTDSRPSFLDIVSLLYRLPRQFRYDVTWWLPEAPPDHEGPC